MKQQVKLTESELYDVIRESVKSLVTEYGKKPENREKMAKAAQRAIKERGDDGVYHNAVNSISKGGGSNEDLKDFNKKFETNESKQLDEYTNFDKMKAYGPDYDEDFDDDFNEQPANIAAESKNSIKVTETQLKNIIRESIKILLSNKTRLR